MVQTVKLYVIPLSHPGIAVRMMLEHKGLEHEVVELLSGLHRWSLHARGFSEGTVPAMRVDGRRVEGSRRISRSLDEMEPQRPLFPRDRARRDRVEEAERWGEAQLQPIPRRLARWALVRDLRVRRQLAELNHLPLPSLAGRLMRPLASYFARISGADDDAVREDLARLPAILDRVDELIARETIAGERPNAADFQIATSVRCLLVFEQLRDLIDARPAATLARRLLPKYPGKLSPTFPAAWLPSS